MPDDVKFMSQAVDTPVTVTGLDHVVLRVASIERSIEFYGKVLGCPVERRLESIGLVQLRAGTSMIDLVPCGPGEEPGRNMDHYAVRIAKMDVPAVTAHLERTASRSARCCAATAPKATARRSTSPTRTATPSS
jgi:catechol-2,3-dioxygenase